MEKKLCQFWIDRGGTFTDVVGKRPDGTLVTHKLLSENPEQYKDAAVAGIRHLLGLQAGEPVTPALVECVKMGTTVATNALLERKGEPTLLITTKGFKDALRIAYQNRPRLFDRHIVLPELLYERGITFHLTVPVSVAGVTVPLAVRVQLQRLAGRLLLHLPAPHADRGAAWIAFEQPPQLELAVDLLYGEQQLRSDEQTARALQLAWEAEEQEEQEEQEEERRFHETINGSRPPPPLAPQTSRAKMLAFLRARGTASTTRFTARLLDGDDLPREITPSAGESALLAGYEPPPPTMASAEAARERTQSARRRQEAIPSQMVGVQRASTAVLQ